MRLIDADKLLEETRKDRDYAKKNGFLDMYYERQTLIDRIESQPTAYNVDKVVEELPDDICEWELKNACYTTSIKHYYSLPTSIVKTFNNCPYCGKKIKDVE